MDSAAAPTIELFPAVRSTNTPFLTCYGNVPSGYPGIIILPTRDGTVNTAAASPPQEIAQVTIRSDLLALTGFALPPLSTPSRTGHANPDPGELGAANRVPGDMSPISSTWSSQTPISATKGSTNSGLSDKVSLNHDGFKAQIGKGSKYSDYEDKKISEHVEKYFPEPVKWGPLSVELGRPYRGLESRWYKIRHLYPDIGVDKRSAKRTTKKEQDAALKSEAAEKTPEKGDGEGNVRGSY